MEELEEEVLDFRGVQSVGQGFADEVFRVWARAHPGTRVVPEQWHDSGTMPRDGQGGVLGADYPQEEQP